jgi:hypothetical protein
VETAIRIVLNPLAVHWGHEMTVGATIHFPKKIFAIDDCFGKI